jgi:hypothetical protein
VTGTMSELGTVARPEFGPALPVPCWMDGSRQRAAERRILVLRRVHGRRQFDVLGSQEAMENLTIPRLFSPRWCGAVIIFSPHGRASAR